MCVGGLVQSSGPEKNKKMEEGQIHSLLELDVHLLLPLDYQSSWFLGLQTLVLNSLASLVLGTLNSEGITPLAFLVPWLADSRRWDFSISITV